MELIITLLVFGGTLTYAENNFKKGGTTRIDGLIFLLATVLITPYTWLHENTHLVVSKLLGGKPFAATLAPNLFSTGFVIMSNVNWANRFFIGLAPIILWGLSLGLVLTWGVPSSYPTQVLLGYMLLAGIPSSEDINLMKRGRPLVAEAGNPSISILALTLELGLVLKLCLRIVRDVVHNSVNIEAYQENHILKRWKHLFNHVK